MPHIQWGMLPSGVKQHLIERARVREITAGELTTLLAWISTNPKVPDGPWCKDFGSFKLVGEGSLPKSFLTKDQPCFGKML